MESVVSIVRNRDVYDVYCDYKKNVSGPNSSKLLEIYQQKFPCHAEIVNQIGAHRLYVKLLRLHDKIKVMKKNKLQKALAVLLDEPFQPVCQSLAPQVSSEVRALQTQLKHKNKETKQMKRKLEHLEQDKEVASLELEALEEQFRVTLSELRGASSSLIDENKCFKQDLTFLAETLASSKNQFEEKCNKLDKIQSKYDTVKSKHRCATLNDYKKIQRRDEKINELTQLNSNLSETIADKDQQLTSLEEMQNKIRNYQIKLSKLKSVHQSNLNIEKSEPSETHDIIQLEQKLDQATKENNDLQKLINLLQDDEIVTFENGKYCDEIREVIIELLSLNVSMNKINDVIRIVLDKLAHKQISRLPSHAIKCRLLVEARNLAHIQVAESLMESDCGVLGNCLHGDGTTKYHRHYQNFQVTLQSGQTLSLGLKEVAGGDTASILQAFNETVTDLADCFHNSHDSNDSENREQTISKLVSSIKSTMSDRGAVNPSFNAQLAVLRESLLPKAIEKWSSLSPDSKSAMIEMSNFYCKMHLLPNMATEADKVMKLYEDITMSDKSSPHIFQTSESGTARLVRTATKAFHARGSDEAGVASYFQSFLNGKGRKNQLVTYRGNRFNILFYDAAATYFHRQDIAEFLSSWPNPNNLLKAVNEDVSCPVYLAGTRALGIVDKIITGPYWRLLEKSGCILDLNPHLLEMKTKMEKWTHNASPLLEEEPLFMDIDIHKDNLYDALFADTNDSEFDTLTIQCLEIVMNGLLIILERQAEDQLPGGKYWEAKENVKQIASSVPKTNKVSEREFASLDLLVRTKPNSTVMSQGAMIMWSHNGTLQWLDAKSDQERKHLLEKARTGYSIAKGKYLERKATLKEQRMEKFQKKIADKHQSEQRRHNIKVKNTNDLLATGSSVWTSEMEMESHLQLKGSKAQRDAVVAQLKFHKTVLKSKGDSKLFALSSMIQGRRKQHCLEVLRSNLHTIIQQNPVSAEVSCGSEVKNDRLRPVEERESNFTFQKEKLFRRLVEQREKLGMKKQKLNSQIYVDNPDLLIGKNIKHKCGIDSGEMWFDAKVLGIKTKSNSGSTEYWVKYEEDPEETKWHFPLLVDLRKGDLIILD